MSVWYAIPTKRPAPEAAQTLKLWQERGYRLAVYCDTEDELAALDAAGVQISIAGVSPGKYPGYANAVNELCRMILMADGDALWIVTGGDDVQPDLAHSAEEISAECTLHFGGTYGVMQPTGDRWGDDPFGRARWPDAPAYIDRICGSPWMGREFCTRAHSGTGPLHSEFYHMHVDEALFEYVKMLGILWQRRDLIHLHNQWGRDGDPSKMPEFLRYVSGPDHWEESKAILNRLKAERFASCLPLEAV